MLQGGKKVKIICLPNKLCTGKAARQNIYLHIFTLFFLDVDHICYGLLWLTRVISFRYLPLRSPGNIYFLLNFFRDAGPKCPVDNERLSESQVSKLFLA